MHNLNLTILCLLLFLTLGVSYLWINKTSPAGRLSTASSVTLGPAPNFTFTTIEDKNGQLYDFKGKIVLVNFWATWCAPCVKEYPDLLQLAQKMNNKVVLLALSNDQNPEAINQFINKNTPDELKKLGNVHIIWDENQHITQKLFQTFKLPETVIIAPDMTIQDKVIGLIDWTEPEIERRLENLYLKN